MPNPANLTRTCRSTSDLGELDHTRATAIVGRELVPNPIRDVSASSGHPLRLAHYVLFPTNSSYTLDYVYTSPWPHGLSHIL